MSGLPYAIRIAGFGVRRPAAINRLRPPFVGQRMGSFVSSENACDLEALRTLIDAGMVSP